MHLCLRFRFLRDDARNRPVPKDLQLQRFGPSNVRNT